MVGEQVQETKGNLNALWLMAAIFIAPMLYAVWQFNSETDWSTRATRNHGELVRPARPLQAFTLQTLEGKQVGLEQLQKKWSMVMVANRECTQTCEEMVYKTRQVRLAQGKEMHRVQRVLILDQARPGEKQLWFFRQQHPDLLLLTGSPTQVELLISQFGLPETVSSDGRVFMIDPLGNHMMNYASGFEAEGLLKDIRRLLHVSQIG